MRNKDKVRDKGKGARAIGERERRRERITMKDRERGQRTEERTAAREWMQKHLLQTTEILLQKPYVLDVDPTVKPV